MRKLVIVLCVLIVFCGCEQECDPPLQQSAENIVEIRLIDNSSTVDAAFKSLTGSEIMQFINDMLTLTCYKRAQPSEDFGIYEIHILYSDGSVDILGSNANGYMTQGELVVSGWFYYPEESMRTLFSAYQNDE